MSGSGECRRQNIHSEKLPQKNMRDVIKGFSKNKKEAPLLHVHCCKNAKNGPMLYVGVAIASHLKVWLLVNS